MIEILVPNSDLRRDIPGLTRSLSQEQIGRVERTNPGPYRLEGFAPHPPERYGIPPGTFYLYEGNRYNPKHPLRNTKLHKHIIGCYDELRSHFGGMPFPRLKVFVVDYQGRRIYVDSQVLDKARRLIIATGT